VYEAKQSVSTLSPPLSGCGDSLAMRICVWFCECYTFW